VHRRSSLRPLRAEVLRRGWWASQPLAALVAEFRLGQRLVAALRAGTGFLFTFAPQLAQKLAPAGRSCSQSRHLLIVTIWWPQLEQKRASRG